ncbi:SMI1/KNR4 family protein [Spirillospora sp. NPDC048832]
MAESDDALPEPLSDREHRVISKAGLALFAGRLILEAQPPIDDEVLGAVAERCAGPLPEPLVALWRTAFGGRLDYDLRTELDGQDVPLSFAELFYPDSDGYHDLWGWIDHECELAEEHLPDWSGKLVHLPIGGFEYLERVYVDTAAGPDHGAVVCWRQGLPPGWELSTGDRTGRLADDLRALFGRLVLDQDPWETDVDSGAEMRDAIDELEDSGDPDARSAATKVRRLVQATVLDWRGALEEGTLAGQRRLRRLALERVAADDDVALLARLVAMGCDPAEEINSGLSPLEVALRHRASEVTRWLLEQGVPVENSLRVAAHTVDVDLARTLLDRGAPVDASSLTQVLHNEDPEVVHLLSRTVQPDERLAQLGPRLRMLAAQAALAGDRLSAQSDTTAAEREQRRSSVLTELADRIETDLRRT